LCDKSEISTVNAVKGKGPRCAGADLHPLGGLTTVSEESWSGGTLAGRHAARSDPVLNCPALHWALRDLRQVNPPDVTSR
jgi:hypothetical protein